MADNTVTLVGNCGRDPEIRYTQGGQAKADFGLAVSRRWQDRASGEWKEQTSWIRVVCWGQLAENVAESVTKGTRVVVTGRLEQREYEADGGEKKQVVEVVADEIAPSLRWATAQVQKNDRRDGMAGGGAPQARGASSGGRGPGGGGYEPEEEPF
jgi:single-strand DNA-binding protein